MTIFGTILCITRNDLTIDALNLFSNAARMSIFHENNFVIILGLIYFTLANGIYQHRKVLRRECKRHTARHVASADYADLSPDERGEGVPHPVLDREVPHPVLDREGTPSSLGQCRRVPHPVLDEGVPHPVLNRGYPIQSSTGGGVPPRPRPGMGYSPFRPGMGYPPISRTGYPFSRCGITHKVKLLPSPILRMRAVKLGSMFHA